MTGIDASEDNVKMAKWHAQLDPAVNRNVTYRYRRNQTYLLHTSTDIINVLQINFDCNCKQL